MLVLNAREDLAAEHMAVLLRGVQLFAVVEGGQGERLASTDCGVSAEDLG